MKATTGVCKLFGSGSGGQTAAEFGLVATALFLLMFGMMSLGSAVYDYNTLSSAAREAVRYATIHSPTSANPATDDQIKQVAIDYAQGIDIDKSNVSVNWPTDPNITIMKDAQVTVAYKYNLNIPFMSPVALNLSSTSRMLVSQ
jgi:Flp pilus assembly protein TadG